MFGFLIKKWFFDYWDHFFHFAVLNIGFVLSLLIPTALPSLLIDISPLLSLAVLILGVLWIAVYTAAMALYAHEIAQYRTPEAKMFFRFMKESWKSGLGLGSFWVFIALILWVIIPFYGAMESMLGLAAMAFLGWTVIVLLLALQYYLPIRAQLDKKPGKLIRKMFIIFFDNAGFSIMLFIFSTIVTVISGFSAFLLFGPAGFVLMGQEALKLRLYKYDYLEQNPESNRKKIPWSALLHDDRERIGRRSLKGMIFPWKD